MQKWILSTLLAFIMQATVMVGSVEASQINSTASSTSLKGEQSLQALKKGVSTYADPHCPRGPTGATGLPGPSGGGFGNFASYWLTNQPSLSSGQNVVFNLQQTIEGIQYDDTTGIFTLPAGVYVINFFATPNNTFNPTLNLLVNGTVIPNPGLEGVTVVVDLSASNNAVAVQAAGDWTPQTGDIGSYFFAYASIVIYQIGS